MDEKTLDALPPPQGKQKQKKRGSKKEQAQRLVEAAQKKIAAQQAKARELKKRIEEQKQNIKTAANKHNILVPASVMSDEDKLLEKVISGRPVAFRPNDGPQTEFLSATEKEVFYGGARGGGKSYSLIVDPLRYCHKSTARALILRRTMPELRDLINHSQKLYPQAFNGVKWREQEKEFRFPSGSRIEFGYAETRQDALRYQGQSYSWIGVDELPQYPTADIWNDLRGSLRSVDPDVPEYMRATGNPGNVGSNWVKSTFITPAEWGQRFFVDVELPDGTVSHISRRFIPAKLTDNPYLTRTKSYMTMLASLPETQRKQWLEGNWDVWDGAAFPEFDRDIHTCDPFELPKSWVRIRGGDWGYTQPAFIVWGAIDYDNNIWIYREYKTKLKTADIVAKEIKLREANERIRYGVLDSSVWSRRGDIGPSIVDTMRSEGVQWRPSDRSPNSRHAGKAELHRRFAINEFTKQPTIKIFRTCTNLINEIPTLPLDENDPEDVDTKSEDHGYDALRYLCMSRPLNPARVDELARTNEQIRYQPSDTVFGY